MFKTLVVASVVAQTVLSKSNPPCKWDSRAGAHYDLSAMTIKSGDQVYAIVDGDIPCTPETEPSYGYVWNFCANIPDSAVPKVCSDLSRSTAVALQWADYGDKGQYCYVLAKDQSSSIIYSLLDSTDPSKGISIAYPKGEKCQNTAISDLRSATIDVKCANVDKKILSAQEPSLCNYHLQMESYYGCPTECEVTKNGLCDSKGHCAYDYKAKQSYCYCNEGYGGSDCSSKTSGGSTTYDGFSVQLGLLITLLLVAAGLTAGVAYMAYQIAEFRKHQISNNYKSLSGGEAEMTETVNFRN